MSEDQNLPAEESTENSLPGGQAGQPFTEENTQPLTDSQLQTTIPVVTGNQPQTENMEVHKHPHHVTHKKKWTEYLLEFFMLFLAVFLGFVAENMREHAVEKEREKQYMQSFIYDLQNDTANLIEGFPRKDGRIAAIDSFFLFFENHPNADVIPGNVVRYMRRSLWDRHYRRNNTTIEQLKNAGGFRLIRKKNIADSIAAYDLLWQRAEFWREGYTSLQEKGKDMLHKIIEAAPLLSKYRLQPSFTNQKVDSLRVNINRQNLNEFFNFLADQKIWTTQDEQAYKDLEKSAERLIALIKKEYRLE